MEKKSALYCRVSTGHQSTGLEAQVRSLRDHYTVGVGFVSITESIDTNTPLGSAVFTILGAVAQLERDLIAERVRNGLANAKAKGVRLGRMKTRDSDLIRKLRASGMTYRQIGQIARCSSGAVSAEIRQMKQEGTGNALKRTEMKPEPKESIEAKVELEITRF